MNKVTLIGRMTAEPQLKLTNNGQKVCRFSLAVNRQFKNADGERKADFINCMAWQQRADLINNYVHKGDLLAVEGRIQVSSYIATDGIKRYMTDVIVEQVEFLSSKKSETKKETIEQPDPFESFGENVAIDDNFLD